MDRVKRSQHDGAEIQTFEEFWPYYLGEHSDARTRQFHILGTAVAIGSLAAYAVTRRRRFLVSALAGSYGPAWLSHAAIEHNKPATFTYPWWSLRADLKMFSLWLDGKLDKELEDRKIATGTARRTVPVQK
ncbi:MAG: DUF962 domain-containing protein [Hyphomicrobiaceae bacterium]|nr:DUF962 domain-containing protein [Hyphomicrobiaceae bacterium]